MENRTARLIYEKRKALGLTQQELADRLQVTNKAVSKWENGDGMPDVQLLAPLARALGVTVDELLNGEETASPVSEEAPTEQKTQAAPKKAVTACIIACVFVATFIIKCVKGLVQIASVEAFGRTFVEKLGHLSLCLGIAVFWCLVLTLFVGKFKKMNGKNVKYIQPLSIFLFVAGLIMTFGQQTIWSPLNYGTFWFSFAILLSGVHGCRVPYKIFYALTFLSVAVFGIMEVGGYIALNDLGINAMNIAASVIQILTAVLFYVFYGLLEKYTAKYSENE